MSHELRTPLNAVLGFSQLLELEDLNEASVECVELIRQAGRHLLDLIDEVLDIARIESGQIELVVVPVSVRDVVRETVDLLTTQAREVHVLLRVDPDASDAAVVLADHQRLKQVLLNLLSNGVKYNRAGGEVAITWSIRPGGVRLCVQDTGRGIRASLMDRLFDPFDRLDAGGDVEGTGLGLAVSKRLVDTMGGTISVESVLGEGSRFSVDFPAGPPEEGPTASASQPKPAATRRILYVEDNLSNLRLVDRILTRRPDIELVPSLQGSLAVELARRHRPDLILLDLNLPDLPGRDALHQLVTDLQTSDIPVIIVSADAMSESRTELLAMGAFAYVTKPFDVVDLLGTIDRALARTRTDDRKM